MLISFHGFALPRLDLEVPTYAMYKVGLALATRPFPSLLKFPSYCFSMRINLSNLVACSHSHIGHWTSDNWMPPDCRSKSDTSSSPGTPWSFSWSAKAYSITRLNCECLSWFTFWHLEKMELCFVYICCQKTFCSFLLVMEVKVIYLNDPPFCFWYRNMDVSNICVGLVGGWVG